jgi:alanine dehydrogenase
MKLANMGAIAAMRADMGLLEGLNTYKGEITYKAVAESQGRNYKEAAAAL